MPDARDLSNTAVELAESGQYDEALALVNKGIKLDSNNANSWYNKGIILFKMCRYQDFSITGAGPMVEVFQKRMEISNPGKPLISPDRFIDHPPRSRNELLASMMRRINI
ncbi:MAG: ATP-binding protein [Methanoregula sp.]|nr:ATP-binding protein [Methanoregula sp.]